MFVFAVIVVVCILSIGSSIIEGHPMWKPVSAYQLGFALGFLGSLLSFILMCCV